MKLKKRRLIALLFALGAVVVWLVVNPASYESEFTQAVNDGADYAAEAVSIPVLAVYGSEDGVLNLEKYEQTVRQGHVPADYNEKIIEGGNHAQFGDYGEQKGDGKANITAEKQQALTAEAISSFVK